MARPTYSSPLTTVNGIFCLSLKGDRRAGVTYPVALSAQGVARVQPDAIIEVEGLVKRYGSFTAVDGISFRVAPRECLGFLGPNGAGKTTTVGALACALPHTTGLVRGLGHDGR